MKKRIVSKFSFLKKQKWKKPKLFKMIIAFRPDNIFFIKGRHQRR